MVLNQRLEEGKEIMIRQKMSMMVLSEKVKDIPQSFELSQNYPNPFNPTTVIRYGLPEAAKVRLTVYNVLGEQIAELLNEERGAGYHEVNFNASGIASGVYYYRIETGSFVSVRKLVVVK